MKYTERQVAAPLCAMSTTPGLMNKTGSWKFARPVFIDRTSPCTEQCPAGEDISGYIYLASQERFEEAWKLITEENPFPAIMGRICFHPCEDKCNRSAYDEPVSIHCIERFIGDYGLSHNLKIPAGEPEQDKNIAVVGSGPAGLAVAYHLRRMGYPVAIFDKEEKPGGLMRYGIPPSRLPKEILDGELNRLADMGITFKMGVYVGDDIGWEQLTSDYDALFIAPGALKEQSLKIEGVETEGVFYALDFLKAINCGERPVVGKRVVVIGGGNSAVDCARSSRRLGAEVTIVYRRSEAEMPAHTEEIKMAQEEGVRLHFLAAPQKLSGAETISGITLEKMALGEVDESGRRRPKGTGETFDMGCDTVIIAIGEVTKTEALPPDVVHQGGVVQTDGMGRSTRTKIFAGGDIIDIPHTVTHAIGSGKRAALAIARFLKGADSDTRDLDRFRWAEKGAISIAKMKGVEHVIRRNPSSEVADSQKLNSFYFDHRPAINVTTIPVSERLADFIEVVQSPSESDVVTEARRCFICGSCTECGNCYIFCPDSAIKPDPGGYGYIADMDYCKGCGICVYECPRGAMNMEFME